MGQWYGALPQDEAPRTTLEEQHLELNRLGVANASAKGDSLLMNTENTQLYMVLDLGQKDHSDFVPININARSIPFIAAKTPLWRRAFGGKG